MSLNKPTFCVASIINDSPTLQKLVDLGVDLSYWEKIRKVSSWRAIISILLSIELLICL